MSKGVLLDLASYNRLEHFNYFRSMDYPFVGITCDVDITRFYDWIKREDKPFFLSFLWCVGRAANMVRQFRQRIENDGIIEFDYCYTSHTVAMEDETYSYCSLDCSKDFEEFVREGKLLQESAKDNGSIKESHEEAKSLIFVSSMPWATYSSLIQPVSSKEDSNPRITWGKFCKKGDTVIMPVSVLCHHALVDGVHIGKFYGYLEEILASFGK